MTSPVWGAIDQAELGAVSAVSSRALGRQSNCQNHATGALSPTAIAGIATVILTWPTLRRADQEGWTIECGTHRETRAWPLVMKVTRIEDKVLGLNSETTKETPTRYRINFLVVCIHFFLRRGPGWGL